MRPLGPARLRALLAAFVAALLSCVDAPTAPRPMAITTATPEALSLFPLDTAWLSAQVRGLDGAPIPGATLQWRSLDTTVASVLPSGLVTARDYTGPAVRQTSILVTAAEASTDTVPVEVLPWQVARVIADSQTATLAVGGSTSLGVRLEAANGTPLTDRDILWIADDTAVVRVNATGLVTARPYFGPLERSTRVIVFAAGLSDTTVVTVLPVTPASLQLAPSALTLLPGAVDSVSVVVRSAAGDTLREFPLLWESTDTTVARVNAAGVVTASYYVGAATRAADVIVTLGSLADTIPVEVPPLAVAGVAIADGPRELQPGRSLQLGATLTDAAGLFLTDRVPTWTSSDTSIARVDSTGLVLAAAYGGPDARTVHIIASSAAAADTVQLTLPPLEVAWVTATPEALSLRPQDTMTVSVELQSLDLIVLSGRSATWASLDTLVARVDANGLVTASAYTGAAVRNTRLVVTSGPATDTVPVEVLPLPVERVVVSPASLVLSPGDSASLSVAPQTLGGLVLTGRDVFWIASDTSIVTVSQAGTVRAVPYVGPLERSAQVVVYSNGMADTADVTVQPLTPQSLSLAPDTVTLTPGALDSLAATVRSAGGDTLLGAALAWRSSDTTVARVNIEGIVTASYYVGAATRSATVTVTLGGLVDSTLVHVLPLAIATVDIAPDSVSLLPGAAAQFDVTIRDAAGLFLEGRAVTWTSLDTTVARVDASGRVTALASGDTATRSALVVASAAATADTVRITVSPHAVAWVTATPEALSLMPGDTLRIAASLAALDLTILTDRRVDWQSLNPAIAAVDSSGLVSVPLYTGPSLRNTAVVLSSGGAADTVPVEVLPLPVARAIATPTAISLAPGDSADLGATVESATGVVLSGRGLLWLSSDTAVIAVDSASGRVTARPYLGQATRTAAVVVYSEGVADTVDVTVTPLVPALLEAAPDTLAIVPGQQASLSATIRASSGAALSGLTVSWASSDTSIAIVNADGIVTAVFYVGADERPTSIVATSGALADTVHLRVLPLAVDSIAVFPDTQTLRPEQTLQLSAVLRDSAGLFLSGRVVAWTSSDTVLATVSDSGVVTALVAGEVSITASSGGVSAAANITIEPVVTTVRVTPGLSTVWIGRTQPFTVALQDTNGASPTGRRVRWRSTDPGVATVDSLGVVTGLAPGLVSVIATSEGRADSATVDVFAEPTAAVTISFDDSWRGVLELAYPEMQALRLRANVGWITNVDWAGVMNPTELRQLQDAGWSIVSHSATHPYLTAISIDSARAELARSRARIDSLGFDPRVFIAPYLDHNDAVLLESAAAGYTYTRCCAQDSWSTDTLVQWPIQPAGRHRLAGVDLTNYDGQVTSYNFRTVEGRDRLRTLLNDVVAAGKFLDVFFHDIVPEDLPDLRLTLEILADFRPYLITYGMLPD